MSCFVPCPKSIYYELPDDWSDDSSESSLSDFERQPSPVREPFYGTKHAVRIFIYTPHSMNIKFALIPDIVTEHNVYWFTVRLASLVISSILIYLTNVPR